jgi:hypothetical protein
MRLVLSVRKITRVLTLTVSCLTITWIVIMVTAYYSGHDKLLGLTRQFDLDGEANIPTWYQSTALLLCSALLGTIACAKKADADRFASYWKALSIIFLFLAIDETALIHDMITYLVRRSGYSHPGFFYYAWVIPYGIFAGVVAVGCLKFLAHLPARSRLLFIIAGAIYVGGALGMEMISGFYRSLYWQKDLPYLLMNAFEETLEMLGIVVFIYALTSYMSRHVKDVQVHFSEN